MAEKHPAVAARVADTDARVCAKREYLLEKQRNRIVGLRKDASDAMLAAKAKMHQCEEECAGLEARLPLYLEYVETGMPLEWAEKLYISGPTKNEIYLELATVDKTKLQDYKAILARLGITPRDHGNYLTCRLS